MRTDDVLIGVSYLRLSDEDKKKVGTADSSSIENQRMLIQNYCRQHGITLVKEFVDDGWSGGNFDRPGFREMLHWLEQGKANLVITKDLSRLGRDMRESSYYSEQYFPEHGIRYIAIGDNFDSQQENMVAPFLFAMNEVYLRDVSRKVNSVLTYKRESGQYCACPPYGYRKSEEDRHRLAPDPETAPVVQRIFRQAAAGDSARKIALDLNEDGVIPPLKYRALYRDNFSDKGAARASDEWNYTTVKRILKNRVYLGHTLLGKTKKVSFKSKMKVPVPKDDWSVTEDTHPALVTEEVFDRANRNLGKGSRQYADYPRVRKSIFSGVAVCSECGHALCSCGTVYKGEREKYWYLSCTHQRKDIPKPCSGVRVRYEDLVELVRRDLNGLLAMSDEDIQALTQRAVERLNDEAARRDRKAKLEKSQARLNVINKMVTKLYLDNAEGKLADDRLHAMVEELERESAALKATLEQLSEDRTVDTEENYRKFFALAKEYTEVKTLDWETVHRFVERIEVGPKVYTREGTRKVTHRNIPFRQEIRIFYRFIGEVGEGARKLSEKAG